MGDVSDSAGFGPSVVALGPAPVCPPAGAWGLPDPVRGALVDGDAAPVAGGGSTLTGGSTTCEGAPWPALPRGNDPSGPGCPSVVVSLLES